MTWLEVWTGLWRMLGNAAKSEAEFPAVDGPSVSVTVPLGSGYDADAEQRAHVQQLRGLCEDAVNNPSWEAKDGKTYCNVACRCIAQGMGYFGFADEEDADHIVVQLRGAADWRRDTIERAWAHAMKGGLAIIGYYEEPHGHVVTVYPGPMEFSDKWDQNVPLVAHVGNAPNGVKKLSWAFALEDRDKLEAYLYGDV